MARYSNEFYEKKERKGRFNVMLALIAAVALLMTGFFMSVENRNQPVFYSSAVQADVDGIMP